MHRPGRPMQSSIQAFAAVSKPNAGLNHSARKRKHDPSQAEDESSPVLSISASIKKRKILTVSPPGTPTKAIKHHFANFTITSPAPALKRKRHVSPAVDIVTLSPPATPPPSSQLQGFPQELEELRRLSSAFLSSLTLHYAHNGSSSSIDLRILTPSITKLWGTRKVTIEDIRLLVAITHSTSTSQSSRTSTRFTLKDYGDGKVSIQIVRARRGRGAVKTTFNEADTNATFNTNLDVAWDSWSRRNSEGESRVEAFLKSISLEPLAVSDTVAKIAPLRAKGQRRLEEVLTPFKNFNLSDDSPARPGKRTKNEHEGAGPLPSYASEEKENTKPVNSMDRTLSLLDRIKAKEVMAASLPAAPTKDERERMAALQRAEELLEILNLLAVAKGGSARTSFPLSALVSSIQSSIRSPLSKEEITRCIKVLQMEVAPGHISMVTFGSVTGVVVDRNRKPGMADVKARLRAKGVKC